MGAKKEKSADHIIKRFPAPRKKQIYIFHLGMNQHPAFLSCCSVHTYHFLFLLDGEQGLHGEEDPGAQRGQHAGGRQERRGPLPPGRTHRPKVVAKLWRRQLGEILLRFMDLVIFGGAVQNNPPPPQLSPATFFIC